MACGNGGPAFPQTSATISMRGTLADGGLNSGMSLRDYFAAKAMQGELACQSEELGEWALTCFHELAGRCYSIADAMLAAREASNAPTPD